MCFNWGFFRFWTILLFHSCPSWVFFMYLRFPLSMEWQRRWSSARAILWDCQRKTFGPKSPLDINPMDFAVWEFWSKNPAESNTCICWNVVWKSLGRNTPKIDVAILKNFQKRLDAWIATGKKSIFIILNISCTEISSLSNDE